MSKFNSCFKIYYEDVDIGGIVYHANYLKYFERSRTDFLNHLGFNLHALLKEEGVQFAVKNLQINFIKPAYLGEEITVMTELVQVTGAKLVFEQKIFKKKAENLSILCKGEVVVVCLNHNLKLIRIPSQLKEELKP